MKLNTDDRYMLFQLVKAILIGCAVVLLVGCDGRSSRGNATQQKESRSPTNSGGGTAKNPMPAGLNQAPGDVKGTVEFTPHQYGATGAGGNLNDVVITRSIQAELRKDTRFNTFQVNVGAVKGEVTLKGEVNSSELRSRAESVAASTAGVTKVNNYIRLTWTK